MRGAFGGNSGGRGRGLWGEEGRLVLVLVVEGLVDKGCKEVVVILVLRQGRICRDECRDDVDDRGGVKV